MNQINPEHRSPLTLNRYVNQKASVPTIELADEPLRGVNGFTLRAGKRLGVNASSLRVVTTVYHIHCELLRVLLSRHPSTTLMRENVAVSD